ncbi:MAG: AMP-binding protein, partial [Aliifodinibius sp.]|nr:AMP-binding protein [candidate division Zixibacteria bacterium]NIT55946.1 AMP-binding protein [Fodinibius sp.]NIW44088.1 AMP-binding protein [Gammaproteobacteria bacterium]NIS49312.1 AMP-binding protein [candidate division Zixibacteria bacterium]NIU17379.1 AMP-binding protein [candidate division Zixibacteria bacterium]
MDRHQIANYEELYQRSIEDIAWFWNAVMDDLDIQFYHPYHRIVDLSDNIQFPQWCVAGKMNIIHNCLDKWQSTSTRDQIALRWEGEEGEINILTYAELYAEVNRCANALRELGIGKGDGVGLYMPMTPELAIAFLAIIKIGGIILPLFSGYGPSAISTRLADADAKALFTANGMCRRGKVIPMKPIVDEALQNVSSVQKVIVVQRIEQMDISWNNNRDYWWDNLVPSQSPHAETEQTDAEDVLMVIYTSGTTGTPKGAVHTHCGFPIKAAQDMYHPMDLKPQDTMYWMSDMGWMMGPWEVFGSLVIGASMVFYDGAPDFPSADRLWKLVADHQVTHLGISPTLIRALKSRGDELVRKH